MGYEATEAETDLLAFRQDGGRVDLLLHRNPFYLESGGQVSDVGVVAGPVGGAAHTPEEYLEVASLVPRAQAVALAILRLD